jgi:hypothetical protein
MSKEKAAIVVDTLIVCVLEAFEKNDLIKYKLLTIEAYKF